MSIAQRILNRLSTPPGVIPWGKFSQKQHPYFKHHWRALWAVPNNKNIIVTNGIKLFQFLSWYLLFAWKHLLKGLRFLKKTDRASGQNGKLRLVKLLYVYTIPFPYIIKYQLLECDPSTWLSHIYPHEISNWQMVIGNHSSPSEQRLLSDKQYFASVCGRNNLPCIETQLEIQRQSDRDVFQQLLLNQQSYFIKPPNTNRSHGCYHLFHKKDNYFELSGIGNNKLISESSLIIEELMKTNDQYDLIVQSPLKNIEDWKNFSVSDELITLRLITEYDNGCQLLAGVIEIPIKNRHRIYDVIPIDPIKGIIHQRFFRHDQFPPDKRKKVLMAKIVGSQIPHWQEVLKILNQVHALCPNHRMVGWDLAITPRGPVLIEGNAGWDTIALTMNELAIKKLIDIEV